MDEAGADGDPRLEAAARAHGFSVAAARCLQRALAAGGGMAQFSHPELGGLGQWAGGGMIMIGEMGNPALRQRVGALCAALAALPGRAAAGAAEAVGMAGAERPWWPDGLGVPSSSGAQGEVAYAWFPRARRLAVRQDGRVTTYDTGEHGITALSQGGAGSPVRLHVGEREVALSDLVAAGGSARGWTLPRVVEATPPAGDAGPDTVRAGDPLATIERLAGLRAAGALTEGEFAAKKTELLARI